MAVSFEIESVKAALEEQTKILNEVQNSKAYKTVEGYHYLKNQKGKDKIRNVGRVLAHIQGDEDERIRIQDPMDALLKSQRDIEHQIDFVGSKLEEYTEYVQVLREIWEAKRKRGAICIFAPYEEIDMPDGYSRRVKNVDGILGDNMMRVYIAKIVGANGPIPMCSIKSKGYISIRYDASNYDHCLLVSMVAHLVGIAYIHSVYQAISFVAEDKEVIKIYDFHGVVSEELLLMGREEEAHYYDMQEAKLVKNTDYIITANQAMKDHIISKYPECNAEFILMPMNNDDNNLDLKLQEEIGKVTSDVCGGKKPVVIYSGGLQKWQLISEMQDAICKEKDKCEFHLYVSDPDEFMKLWGDREVPKEWEVSTKTSEELKEAYKSAQYGFVLRDDIIVNNVACPTKMIDYIKYDIVPIMKSPCVGDFARYGMEYLPINDFLENRFPSEEDRLEMCRKNKLIIDKLLEEYREGKNRVKQIINTKCYK